MFSFKFHKAVEAVAALLRAEHSHRMERLRALKLLYLAERRCLQEVGASITGDRFVAMQFGPVLSETYDLIKGEHRRSGEWGQFFENDGYAFSMVQDPGSGHLSRFELRLLNTVHEESQKLADWELVHLTHQFPEWKQHDPGSSCETIPVEDVLIAVGREKDIETIRAEARSETAIARLLGGD